MSCYEKCNIECESDGVCELLTLAGLEGHICPSLVKGGLEGHICPSVVTSWWHHCDVI